jgi:hypothetical protein
VRDRTRHVENSPGCGEEIGEEMDLLMMIILEDGGQCTNIFSIVP